MVYFKQFQIRFFAMAVFKNNEDPAGKILHKRFTTEDNRDGENPGRKIRAGNDGKGQR
ncbi:MAG: hypothetical protein IJI53_10940 [Clostridia bacterium]|nr:hypothetical protein [Clostridia bacterium]